MNRYEGFLYQRTLQSSFETISPQPDGSAPASTRTGANGNKATDGVSSSSSEKKPVGINTRRPDLFTEWKLVWCELDVFGNALKIFHVTEEKVAGSENAGNENAGNENAGSERAGEFEELKKPVKRVWKCTHLIRNCTIEEIEESGGDVSGARREVADHSANVEEGNKDAGDATTRQTRCFQLAFPEKGHVEQYTSFEDSYDVEWWFHNLRSMQRAHEEGKTPDISYLCSPPKKKMAERSVKRPHSERIASEGPRFYRQEPVLQSNLSKFERFTLYETNKAMYIVGSDRHYSTFRYITLDRTIKQPNALAEILQEDPHEYSWDEMEILLRKMDGEERAMDGGGVGGGSGNGLRRVLSAVALLGFIRFLKGYYVIFITERRKVGCIGGNAIYGIHSTQQVAIHKPTEPLTTWKMLNTWFSPSPEDEAEARYQGLFHFIDLTKDFFFSYSYNLTWSLQQNMTSSPDESQEMFVWNHYLSAELQNLLTPASAACFIQPLIFGAFDQRKFSIFGHLISIVLLARRSRHFAGTRYLKRGVADTGKVANDVEFEQIVEDEQTSEGRFSSFIQYRGSIPIFWSQETLVTNPKPPIVLNRVDPTYTATQKHFADLFERYGSPIVVLNLVKQSEKREREVIVGTEFRNAVQYINSFMPHEHKIRYLAVDYSRISKQKDQRVLKPLDEVAVWSLRETGFFCARPKRQLHDHHNMVSHAKKGRHTDCGTEFWTAYCDNDNDNKNNDYETINNHQLPPPNDLSITPPPLPIRMKMDSSHTNTSTTSTPAELLYVPNKPNAQAKAQAHPTSPTLPRGSNGWLEQNGVLRTNCIDCLDRTNVGQFSVGRRALGQQLYVMGIQNTPTIDSHSALVRELMQLYTRVGDLIALQYGGSEAHKKVKDGREKIKHKELLVSIRRYYSNSFTDNIKQDAINLFLGHYDPKKEQIPLWELESDYYLHNFAVESESSIQPQNSRITLPLPHTSTAALSSSPSFGSQTNAVQSEHELGWVEQEQRYVTQRRRRREVVYEKMRKQSEWWKEPLERFNRRKFTSHPRGASFVQERFDQFYRTKELTHFNKSLSHNFMSPVELCTTSNKLKLSFGSTRPKACSCASNSDKPDRIESHSYVHAVNSRHLNSHQNSRHVAAHTSRNRSSPTAVLLPSQQRSTAPHSTWRRTGTEQTDSFALSRLSLTTLSNSQNGTTSMVATETEPTSFDLYQRYVEYDKNRILWEKDGNEAIRKQFQFYLRDCNLPADDARGMKDLQSRHGAMYKIPGGKYAGYDQSTKARVFVNRQLKAFDREQQSVYEDSIDKNLLRDKEALGDSDSLEMYSSYFNHDYLFVEDFLRSAYSMQQYDTFQYKHPVKNPAFDPDFAEDNDDEALAFERGSYHDSSNVDGIRLSNVRPDNTVAEGPLLRQSGRDSILYNEVAAERGFGLGMEKHIELSCYHK